MLRNWLGCASPSLQPFSLKHSGCVVLGDDAFAETLANHHAISCGFILSYLFGSRGAYQEKDLVIAKFIKPVIDHAHDAFTNIKVMVHGETIMYKMIEDFLIERPDKRTPNACQKMYFACIAIAEEYNITLEGFVENAVTQGLTNGKIKLPNYDYEKYAPKPGETATQKMETAGCPTRNDCFHGNWQRYWRLGFIWKNVSLSGTYHPFSDFNRRVLLP